MKNILFTLLFIFSTHSIYALGVSDWSYETRNGTILSDPGGGIDLYTKHAQLYNLTKWYFYKDHIIGEYRPDINDDAELAYFILDESNGDLKTYNNRELFENNLRSQQLVPILWARWYYDHYHVIQLIWILVFFAWPIAITIVLFISLLIFLSIVLKNKLVKIIFIVITSILLVPIILLMLNDYFTSSI